MRYLSWALAGITLILAGCSGTGQQAAQTPGNYRATWKSVPELQEVMDAMVLESAQALWNVGADEYVPKNEEDWHKLEHAAITLIETAKFIKISHLAKDNPDWPRDSDKFITMAEAMRKAVEEKNLEKLLAAGDALYEESCLVCHNRYFEDE